MNSTPFARGLSLLRDYLDRMGNSPEQQTDKRLLEESYYYLLGNSLCDITRIGDCFPDGIVLFNADGEILYVNKANEEMFGIPWELFGGFPEKYFNATTLEVFAYHKSYTSITVPKRTGRQLLEIGVPLLDDNGELEGVLVIDKDISDIECIKSTLADTQNQLAQMAEIRQTQDALIQALSQPDGAGGYSGPPGCQIGCHCPDYRRDWLRQRGVGGYHSNPQ